MSANTAFNDSQVESILVNTLSLAKEKLNQDALSIKLLAQYTDLDLQVLRKAAEALARKNIIDRAYVERVPCRTLNPNVDLSQFPIPEGYKFKSELYDYLSSSDDSISIETKTSSNTDGVKPNKASELQKTEGKGLSSDEKTVIEYIASSFNYDAVNDNKLGSLGFLSTQTLASESGIAPETVEKITQKLASLGYLSLMKGMEDFEGFHYDLLKKSKDIKEITMSDLKTESTSQVSASKETASKELAQEKEAVAPAHKSETNATFNKSKAVETYNKVFRTLTSTYFKSINKKQFDYLLPFYVYSVLATKNNAKPMSKSQIKDLVIDALSKSKPTIEAAIVKMEGTFLDSKIVGKRTLYMPLPATQLNIPDEIIIKMTAFEGNEHADLFINELMSIPFDADNLKITKEQQVESVQEVAEEPSPEINLTQDKKAQKAESEKALLPESSNEYATKAVSHPEPKETHSQEQSAPSKAETGTHINTVESPANANSTGSPIDDLKALISKLDNSPVMSEINFGNDFATQMQRIVDHVSSLETEVNMWRSSFKQMAENAMNNINK